VRKARDGDTASPVCQRRVATDRAAVPLIRRKVRPNAWSGFRVRETLADPEIWYAANAYAGKYLVGLGLVTALTAFIFYRVPGITLDAYALTCAEIILAALAV
jgi:hypothetical protein